MKPHLYRVAGRWFCRLDMPGNRILGPGREAAWNAYDALRESMGLRWYHRVCPRDATLA